MLFKIILYVLFSIFKIEKWVWPVLHNRKQSRQEQDDCGAIHAIC